MVFPEGKKNEDKKQHLANSNKMYFSLITTKSITELRSDST